MPAAQPADSGATCDSTDGRIGVCEEAIVTLAVLLGCERADVAQFLSDLRRLFERIGFDDDSRRDVAGGAAEIRVETADDIVVVGFALRILHRLAIDRLLNGLLHDTGPEEPQRVWLQSVERLVERPFGIRE